jgi:CHRD domain
MTSTFLRSTLAAVTCTVAIALAGPVLAETVTLKADMTGAAEVPPNTSAGKGTVTATFDTASKKLTWKGSYDGLSGPATAAHFHGPAEPGKNAGVAVPIFAGAAAKTPFEGEATLTDAQAADLLAGKYYANVHTEANKGGEIRGQAMK